MRYDTLIVTDEMREEYIKSNFIDNSEIEKLDHKIKKLQYEYDAESETYKELKLDTKLEKLKEKFKEKHSILTKLRAKYQEELDGLIKRNMYHKKVETGNISKMQYFMDLLKQLEGETRKPVEHVALVRKLCFAGNSQYDMESGVFSREEANDMIRKMLREASIYESKPGHYNRV